MKNTLVAVAASFAALLAISCGGKSTPAARTAPAGIGLTVKTLDRGGEPRERLRYAVAPGRTDTFVLEMELAGLVEMPQGSAAVAAPVLELGVQMGPAVAIDEHTRAYAVRFRAINVRMPSGTTQEEALEVQREVAPLAALAGTFEVDSRGLTRRADLTVPNDLSPRMVTMLGNVRTSLLTIPLPEEAVGVGARWEVVRALDIGGVRVTQTVTYTLADRMDDLLRIGVGLRQTAQPQELTVSDEGDKLAVQSYEMGTVGTSILKLDHLAPLGEARGTSEMRGVLTRGTESHPFTVHGVAVFRMVPLSSEATTVAPVSRPAPSNAPGPNSPPEPSTTPNVSPESGESAPANPTSRP